MVFGNISICQQQESHKQKEYIFVLHAKACEMSAPCTKLKQRSIQICPRTI